MASREHSPSTPLQTRRLFHSLAENGGWDARLVGELLRAPLNNPPGDLATPCLWKPSQPTVRACRSQYTTPAPPSHRRPARVRHRLAGSAGRMGGSGAYPKWAWEASGHGSFGHFCSKGVCQTTRRHRAMASTGLPARRSVLGFRPLWTPPGVEWQAASTQPLDPSADTAPVSPPRASLRGQDHACMWGLGSMRPIRPARGSTRSARAAPAAGQVGAHQQVRADHLHDEGVVFKREEGAKETQKESLGGFVGGASIRLGSFQAATSPLTPTLRCVSRTLPAAVVTLGNFRPSPSTRPPGSFRPVESMGF